MDESEFEAAAQAALEALERTLEQTELDFELKPGGIVEIEFDDGSKIIVNRHAAAREIWVAARGGGFHFRWDGAAWRDTRSGEELFAALSEHTSRQAGEPVSLKARPGG
jgi:CyaY protein